jgi:hypothetical protein
MQTKMKSCVPQLLFALACVLLMSLGLKAKTMADSISSEADERTAMIASYKNPPPR